ARSGSGTWISPPRPFQNGFKFLPQWICMLDKRLLEALSSVFSIDPTAITAATSQENTPGWDSINHLKLIFEIEDAFGVRLSSEEIPRATSVARLQEILKQHQVV